MTVSTADLSRCKCALKGYGSGLRVMDERVAPEIRSMLRSPAVEHHVSYLMAAMHGDNGTSE